jgi:hypothetical protein
MTLSSTTVLNWAVWLIVALIGLTRIPFPFDGDQALFTVGAQQMSQGALLYRDFWDLKQPGIYGFYEIAGQLFGFTEVGIHTFEWLYMMAFAVVLRFTLKRYYTTAIAINLLPLLSVGIYYAACRSWHLTQVEALVSFPLFLCLWFADCAVERGRSPYFFFLSGVMGGVVLLFKFVLFPILLVIWLTQINFKTERIQTILLKIVPPILLGLLVCLLPVILYFQHFGGLELLYRTSFKYPQQILTQIPTAVISQEIGSSWRRLSNGLAWFIPWVSPLVVLSSLGLYFSPQSYRNRLTLSFLLWIVMGLVMIWLQRTSLWAYHYSLVFAPCAILAAKGLDICWEWQKNGGSPNFQQAAVRQIILGLTLAFLLLPTFIPTVEHALLLAMGHLGSTQDSSLEYQSVINPEYKTLTEETAFLSQPGNRPGKIYVFGNPIMYVLSKRTQGIPINGWSLEYLLAEQWQQMAAQFSKALPTYVFVIRSYEDILAQRGTQVHQFIQDRYRLLRRSQIGTWYVIHS